MRLKFAPVALFALSVAFGALYPVSVARVGLGQGGQR